MERKGGNPQGQPESVGSRGRPRKDSAKTGDTSNVCFRTNRAEDTLVNSVAYHLGGSRFVSEFSRNAALKEARRVVAEVGADVVLEGHRSMINRRQAARKVTKDLGDQPPQEKPSGE
jgi:hypothetical protein